MRSLEPRRLAITAALTVTNLYAGAAQATFHFMQIEQVIGAVDGDPTAQAIQLRMRSPGQEQISKARLRAWDADGLNPIELIDYDADVPNEGLGVRILAVTEQFLDYTDPSVTPDFILSEPIPEAYLAAGSITFENDEGTLIVWRFSWGGDAYEGTHSGAETNDDDGDFGPALAEFLLGHGLRGIWFTGDSEAVSSTNAADYMVTDDPAVVVNNAGASFTVTQFNCADDPDDDRLCAGEDNCPTVSNVDQIDTDGDGASDACDACPLNVGKVLPGVCGCNSSDVDTDGDGVADCVDNCLLTTNADQLDSDGDGAGDACDACPDDPAKSDPGNCPCGEPELDSDGDGVADCADNCPADANGTQRDSDADGVGDACDDCPNDPGKTEPELCGCGAVDADGDEDDVADCVDNCPGVDNPDQSDVDMDGAGDACDACPSDANKLEAGACGCGVADDDSDGDGIADCVDNCPEVANAAQGDEDSDGIGDACDERPEVPDSEPGGDGPCEPGDPDCEEDPENPDGMGPNDDDDGDGNANGGGAPPGRTFCGFGMVTPIALTLAACAARLIPRTASSPRRRTPTR